MSRCDQQQGLTLIEVLAALFILAILAAVSLQVVSQSVQVRQAGAEQAIAQLCADNLLTERMLARGWPEPGRHEGEEVLAGQSCFWREEISTTPLPTMRRIDIAVYRDLGRQKLLARVSGFVGRR